MLKHICALFFALSFTTACAYGITAEEVQKVTGLEVQKVADTLRGQGKPLEAIDTYNQAILLYQIEHNYKGILDAIMGRLLSWKHVYFKTEDPVYALFVRKEAESMLSVAKHYKFQEKFYLICYLLGTSSVLLKDYAAAEQELAQAINLYPVENAEKGDWLTHLGDIIYQNGKKVDGKWLMQKGIKMIKDNAVDQDPYIVNIWLSGAYLRLAKVLRDDNPEESAFYLYQAREIINKDERLAIRKQQLEQFEQDPTPLTDKLKIK